MRKAFFICTAIAIVGCSSSILQGPQGVQGATGSTGPQGDGCSTVSVSASGVANRPDEYGGVLVTCGNSETFIANGAPGATGPTGIQGVTGMTGTQGNTGPTGTEGVTGATGASGTNGSNGTNGTNGAQGSTGPIGSQGATGATGSQGNQGNQGVTGATGQAGTSVTTVEFCPDGNTVYPSNFPEQGLCIDNNIFAVYWDQKNLNAWLAEIVPGYYQSTATGLECDFTVQNNCQIEN